MPRLRSVLKKTTNVNTDSEATRSRFSKLNPAESIEINVKQEPIWIDPSYNDEYIRAIVNYAVELEINKIKRLNNGELPKIINISRNTGAPFDYSVYNQYVRTIDTLQYIKNRFGTNDLKQEQKNLVFSIIEETVSPLFTRAKSPNPKKIHRTTSTEQKKKQQSRKAKIVAVVENAKKENSNISN